MPRNTDDYINDEEYLEEEEVDENKRRILCAIGAMTISLPFLALGIRKALMDFGKEDEDNKKGKKKKPSKAPRPRPGKLGETIVRDHSEIIRILNRPNRLKRWFPENDQGKAEKLIKFINDNKDQPWAEGGIRLLKRDIRNGNFELPTGVRAILRARVKYFPEMPLGVAMDLAGIIF